MEPPCGYTHTTGYKWLGAYDPDFNIVSLDVRHMLLSTSDETITSATIHQFIILKIDLFMRQVRKLVLRIHRFHIMEDGLSQLPQFQNMNWIASSTAIYIRRTKILKILKDTISKSHEPEATVYLNPDINLSMYCRGTKPLVHVSYSPTTHQMRNIAATTSQNHQGINCY